jgi:hypothetical protein
MDELYQQWEELVEAGDCSESFEDWYSGKCADAYDRYKASRYDD